MGVPQTIAAALALIATVLAFEGVTRGGGKQLFAAALFAIASALTLSFGDMLSTLNLQMIDPLPRWRDVAHPLPAPEPAPEPKPQVTAPTTATVVAAAAAINFHPTQSPNGKPRFLAVYPRKKFMDKTD